MTTPHRTLLQHLDALGACVTEEGPEQHELDAARQALAALREALAAPEPEPVACLIRHRCGTPSRVSHDGRTHWHEWGEWQIANLAHGKAVTDPARNPTQDGEWQMQPVYAAPPAAPAPAQPVIGTKTWLEDGKLVTLNLTASDIYAAPLAAPDETPAEDVLRFLASHLGAGGYNALNFDARVFKEKILWGIDAAIKDAVAAHHDKVQDLCDAVLALNVVTEPGLRAKRLARELEAAFVAPPAAPDHFRDVAEKVAPDGWVMVPREPTSSMLAALSGEWHPSRYEKYRGSYRAMIAAAPAQPVPQPFSKAQIHRLYVNSPELHKDAASEAAFTRILQLAEAAHGITGGSK